MITMVLRKSTSRVRPLAVGQPAVVEELQQGVEHVPDAPDFVEQDDAEGLRRTALAS